MANRTGSAAGLEAQADGVAALAELQDKLDAQNRWALLLIFQAMDASDKDGAIKHVIQAMLAQSIIERLFFERSKSRP